MHWTHDHDGTQEKAVSARVRALSLGSCDPLRSVQALNWANAGDEGSPALASFTVIPRWSLRHLVRGGAAAASSLGAVDWPVSPCMWVHRRSLAGFKPWGVVEGAVIRQRS